MKISIPNDNGFFIPKYSKQAPADDYYNGNPAVSFPFTITDAPAPTETFAIAMLDFDAIPVCGFPWIHWVAANIPATDFKVPADNSRTLKVPMVQGNNSNAGSLVGESDPLTTRHYTGPLPPDKDHQYTITVFAVAKRLPLQAGFWLNELYHQLDGETLDEATVTLIGKK
ncbi:phospholipid-binding protein [Lactobacillus selangorensis]|uniref:Phospholipid-binding protein n=1 Tax=Lactobacillus selangorensis TaxID=81857 RepID=A0A0R2FHA7_9LACO|nr:YbhB/YbcL family Raf kinase inhibitor-like protein [Lactobacillus selangorensis]KRN27920.1 phospholipid-binding protein [Lactobacillus selangorensis]KRN30609.1 phospholipid-binding protein [Lactobacillus selangorensis]